jgi:hypothetical protein
LVTTTEDRVFERILSPIVRYNKYNREAKASQGGTTENEQEYSILRLYPEEFYELDELENVFRSSSRVI